MHWEHAMGGLVFGVLDTVLIGMDTRDLTYWKNCIAWTCEHSDDVGICICTIPTLERTVP